MDEKELKKIGERCENATQGNIQVAFYENYLDPVEEFKALLAFGSGPVYLLNAIDHVLARKDHYITTAITGNGPASRNNALFYASAHYDIPALIAEVRRLKAAFYWLEENVLAITVNDRESTQIGASLGCIEAAMKKGKRR